MADETILQEQAEAIVQVHAKFVDGGYEVWHGKQRLRANDTHALTAMVRERLRLEREIAEEGT